MLWTLHVFNMNMNMYVWLEWAAKINPLVDRLSWTHNLAVNHSNFKSYSQYFHREPKKRFHSNAYKKNEAKRHSFPMCSAHNKNFWGNIECLMNARSVSTCCVSLVPSIYCIGRRVSKAITSTEMRTNGKMKYTLRNLCSSTCINFIIYL